MAAAACAVGNLFSDECRTSLHRLGYGESEDLPQPGHRVINAGRRESSHSALPQLLAVDAFQASHGEMTIATF